jgi:hypothetical protein
MESIDFGFSIAYGCAWDMHSWIFLFLCMYRFSVFILAYLFLLS